MFGRIWETIVGSSDKIGNLLRDSGIKSEILNSMDGDYGKLSLEKPIEGLFIAEAKEKIHLYSLAKCFGKRALFFNRTNHNDKIIKMFSQTVKSQEDLLATDYKIKIILVDQYEKSHYNFDHKTIGFKSENNYDYIFACNINKDNVGEFFNYKIMGFYHKSFFNSKINSKNNLFNLFKTLIEPKKEKLGRNKKNNAEDNIKNGLVSLNEIMYILNQMETLMNNPIVSRFMGNKVNPQQMQQLKILRAFVQSLTAKERENPDIINESRIKRISIGINKNIMETNNLCQMCKVLLKQMGPLVKKMQENPGEVMKMMQSGNMQNIMGNLGLKT